MINITMYEVALVKEHTKRYEFEQQSISSPKEAVKLFCDVFRLDTLSEEKMVMFTLNTKNKITGAFTVSHGTLDSAIIHPREIFKRALLTNSSSIMLAHNHPSGDSTPSKADIQTTKRISEAGELLGVSLLDHIIIPHGESRHSAVSLREKLVGAF